MTMAIVDLVLTLALTQKGQYDLEMTTTFLLAISVLANSLPFDIVDLNRHKIGLIDYLRI